MSILEAIPRTAGINLAIKRDRYQRKGRLTAEEMIGLAPYDIAFQLTFPAYAAVQEHAIKPTSRLHDYMDGWKPHLLAVSVDAIGLAGAFAIASGALGIADHLPQLHIPIPFTHVYREVPQGVITFAEAKLAINALTNLAWGAGEDVLFLSGRGSKKA